MFGKSVVDTRRSSHILRDPAEVHGVIERIVERESLKASELLLTNGQAQADVIARLQVTCLPFDE